MNYPKNKLSIVLPVYNGGYNLERNLKNFENECNNIYFKNLIELSISDNCSTDGSEKIIKKYKKILEKKKFVKINLYKQKKNLGFAKNLMSSIKISNGEYLMPLCDDSLPQKGFYKQLIDYLCNNPLKELGFVPVTSTKSFTKQMFNLNQLAYVVNRGSILSGVILKNKKANYKLFQENIYLHNLFYIDYYLKYGFKNIVLKSKIKIDIGLKQKIKDKFNDRAGRKIDYGVLEKIKTIDFFYKKKRVNFIKFLFTITTIYAWSIEINILLQKDNHFSLAKDYFKETLKYKNKKIIFLSFLIILLKNLFSKKIFYILKLFINLRK